MAKKSRKKRRELAEKEKRMREMGIEPKKKEKVKVDKVEKAEIKEDKVEEKRLIDNPFVLLFICFLIAFIFTLCFSKLFDFGSTNTNENSDISVVNESDIDPEALMELTDLIASNSDAMNINIDLDE